MALTLTTTDSHGVEATTTVRDFELREPPLASEHSMRLPQSCRAVRLEVTARVARMAPGSNGERREETLAQHVSCAVAPGSCADTVASAHLSLSRSSKSEAVIQVRSGGLWMFRRVEHVLPCMLGGGVIYTARTRRRHPWQPRAVLRSSVGGSTASKLSPQGWRRGPPSIGSVLIQS